MTQTLSRFKWKLITIFAAVFVAMMFLTAHADHSDTVTVFFPQEGDTYFQDDVAPWGIACHVGAVCTRDQVPGGLSAAHGLLNTSAVGDFQFVATGTINNITMTVVVNFQVLGVFEAESGTTGPAEPPPGGGAGPPPGSSSGPG